MGGFNVTGPEGTPTAAGQPELNDILGDTTSVDAFTITGKAGFDSVSALDNNSVYKDDNGDLFAQVTITATNQAEVDNLTARGVEVDGTSATTFNIALAPSSGDVDTQFAKNLDFSSLSSGQTTDPLETIDNALSQVVVRSFAHRRCRLRDGSGQHDQEPDPPAGGHLGSGPGQPAAAERTVSAGLS